jgi:hypothetical protein
LHCKRVSITVTLTKTFILILGATIIDEPFNEVLDLFMRDFVDDWYKDISKVQLAYLIYIGWPRINPMSRFAKAFFPFNSANNFL